MRFIGRIWRNYSEFIKTVFLLGLIIYGVYFFFTGSVFRVSKIDVKPLISDKLLYVDSNEVSRGLRYSIGEHFLFVNEPEIIAFIKKDFEYAEDISISFNFPGSLVIRIKEYSLVASIFQYAQDVKGLSLDGKILPVNKGTSLDGLLKIFVVSDSIYDAYEIPSIRYKDIFSDLELVESGEFILGKKDIDVLLGLFNKFDIKGHKFNYVVYFPIENELHLVLDNKTSVWLEIGDGLDVQWEKFLKAQPLFFQEIENISYIDLRVNEKVILCYTSEPCRYNPHYLEFHYLVDSSYLLTSMQFNPWLKDIQE